MPQTTTKPRTPARKAPAARKSPAKKQQQDAKRIDRTAEFSEEVLKSIESGQRTAIEAVKKFIDTVDETLPAFGERPSKRQEVVDAALEMADRLVHTQYDFLHKVVNSAGKALSKPESK